MTWLTLPLPPCELGESPFWHPVEQRLYWVDIAARRIHRFHPSTGVAQQWAMPSEPGCIAPARPGLVVALRDGVYRATEWGGELTLIAPAHHDVATARFNDGKADPKGRFWASTIYEPRDAPNAQLFALQESLGSARSLKAMAGHATVGNGLAWSPDASTLYWADTSAHSIRAWDWNAEDNTLDEEKIFHQWAPKPPGWQPATPDSSSYQGRPDGAAVDVQGNYFVAMYEGGQVLKLSPAGDVLAALAVPAQCPTMPCFGGDDGCTLYLTTARQKRSDAELLAFPDSGCVMATRVDVPGLPVNFFRD